MEQFPGRNEELYSLEKISPDSFIFSGNLELLKNIGIAVCTELQHDSMIRASDREAFMSGEKQRPGGVFSVYFKNGKLYIQNVNGVGIKQYQEELQRAIDIALSKT